MNIATLREVLEIVEPFVDGQYCLGASHDELRIYVKPIPEGVIGKLRDRNVSLDDHEILTEGGTLTCFV